MDNRTIIFVALALLAFGVVRRFFSGAGVSREVVAKKLREGATVLDVRTAGEFAAGHYEGARSIPVDELGSRFSELGSRNHPVVVYCASGARSARAAAILKRAGFSDVTNAGGLYSMP